MSFCKSLLPYWKTWVMILTPLVFMPLLIVYPSSEGRCAYGICIMAIYWMTEVIPMAATALLPIVIMPWLGVAGSKPLSLNYLKDTNMLFAGGLMVAVAIEKWNLHKRIALKVLTLVGSQPRWLLFGFMSTTAFLSMWISNTATTAMMIPIAHGVLVELEKHFTNTASLNHQEDVMLTEGNGNDAKYDTSQVSPEKESSPVDGAIDQAEKGSAISTETPLAATTGDKKTFKNVSKALTLCIAYAANIGGTATLTGTGPNLVIKGQIDTLYGSDAGINFSSWMIYAFPNALVCLVLTWFWLQIHFLGFKKTFAFRSKIFDVAAGRSARAVIVREYKELGPISFAEIAVLCHFVVLALLWLTRDPGFIPGWSNLLIEQKYVTDASTAITVCVLLFMFPSRRPNFLCFRAKDDTSPPGPVPALLDWKTVHEKLQWNVILVLGGGFAIADACKISGLSAAISNAFLDLTTIPTWSIVLMLCLITATFTEVTSNVATTTIFLPILSDVAASLQIHPLYLMIPVTISASFAFMLPVATPPNAIVFSYGHMKIKDMMKAGILMNVLCIMVTMLSIHTWGYAYFNLGTYPDWATSKLTVNATIAPLINNTALA